MTMFGLPGGWEWFLIGGAILLLFGPTQIPKLAKMFGKSAKALKDGIDGKFADDEDVEPAAEDDETKPVKSAPKKPAKKAAAKKAAPSEEDDA
jgi:sec-independent protein translocase protein TatA